MRMWGSHKSQPPDMSLEGVLGQNGRIDDADAKRIDAPDALCVADGRLLISSGKSVAVLADWTGKPGEWANFDSAVTALSSGPSGQVAVGLADGSLIVSDASGAQIRRLERPGTYASISDCLFLSDEEIAILDTGIATKELVLSLAPWDDELRGQVVAVTLVGEARVLKGGLHFPMGLCKDRDGALIVTEMDRARIVCVDGTIRRAGFPGYLGRLRKTDDGYLLTCLARRDPLIEFIKTETEFVAEMKAKVAPRHWISPRVEPDFSHEFPIELGATRLFGEIKPWAPSFSYGLIIEMDEDFIPVASAHSRANGTRHAISDAIRWHGDLIAVSKASGEVLNLGQSEGSA